MPPTIEIDTPHLHLRTLERADNDRLHEILTAPGIAEWWGVFDRERVEREFPDDEETWLAIELDGTMIGLIGFEEVDDEFYRSAGIDITLHPDYLGRGLGSEAVAALAGWLIENREHHRITIDPAVGNARAIRCYEKVGFKPVGIMRRYEKLAGGGYRDALLMDLLAEELNDP